MLKTVEINPPQPALLSVIWLHGLGADGYDFATSEFLQKISYNLQVRMVFPHAPIRAVTCAGGAKLRAWFDLDRFEAQVKEDSVGINESVNLINQLIDKEYSLGFSSNQLILAGFSQGGAIALAAGLGCSQALGGILSLSSWLPLSDSFSKWRKEANQETPVVFYHGTNDEVVPFSWAKNSVAYLEKFAYQVKLRAYPMRHSVCEQEFIDLEGFFKTLIASA